MKYVIHGKPIARKNPAPLHKKPGLYDTQKFTKESYRYNIKIQHGSKALIKPPISAQLLIYIPMPDSWGPRKRDSHRGKLHTSKPDWSNCLKFIEDCCTGIVFEDDCRLALFSGKKIWADEGKTEFILEHINENEASE